MIETKEMNTFLAIVQEKSFSKAARLLNYSQSTITIQIQHLEDKLHTKLFDRIGKNISLTPQGIIFLNHARSIMYDLQKAEYAVQENRELHGTLRIGTIESLCSSIFPDLLSSFHKDNPNVSISVMIGSPDELLENMNRGQLDFVYILDRRVYNKSWKKLFEIPEEIVFVASYKNQLADLRTHTLDELISQPFILTEKNASYRLILDQYLQDTHRSLTPYLELENTDFIVKQLCANEGISFLPLFSVNKEIRNGQLKVLSIENFHIKIWRQLIYHRDKCLTLEMERFFSIVQKETCTYALKQNS